MISAVRPVLQPRLDRRYQAVRPALLLQSDRDPSISRITFISAKIFLFLGIPTIHASLVGLVLVILTLRIVSSRLLFLLLFLLLELIGFLASVSSFSFFSCSRIPGDGCPAAVSCKNLLLLILIE